SAGSRARWAACSDGRRRDRTTLAVGLEGWPVRCVAVAGRAANRAVDATMARASRGQPRRSDLDAGRTRAAGRDRAGEADRSPRANAAVADRCGQRQRAALVRLAEPHRAGYVQLAS